MFIVPVSRDTQALSRLLDDSFERFFGGSTPSDNLAARSLALDVAETERSYTIKLDMPGVAKEDVKVSVEGRQVTVQAQRQRNEERTEGERLVHRERTQASYARSFTLPLEVDQSDAAARLEHGVLTLTLPKRSARSAAQITVN